MSQIDEELRELLIYANTDKVESDALIIELPNNAGTFYLTSDFPSYKGVDENGIERQFEYIPMIIGNSNQTNDLGYSRQITIQDLNETIKPIVQPIPLNIVEDINIKIYSYVRDEFGNVGNIKEGPFNLIAQDLTYTQQGVAFVATTSQSTGIGTGEIGDLTRVPFLRQFV